MANFAKKKKKKLRGTSTPMSKTHRVARAKQHTEKINQRESKKIMKKKNRKQTRALPTTDFTSYCTPQRQRLTVNHPSLLPLYPLGRPRLNPHGESRQRGDPFSCDNNCTLCLPLRRAHNRAPLLRWEIDPRCAGPGHEAESKHCPAPPPKHLLSQG